MAAANFISATFAAGRSRRVLAVVALGVLLCGTSALEASALTGSGSTETATEKPDVVPAQLSPQDEAVQAAQAPYLDLAEQVAKIDDTSASLAGTEIDKANRRLKVYWSGPVPPALHKLVDAQAGSAVTIHVATAKSPNSALVDASSALDDLNAQNHFGIVTMSLQTDGSGLIVRGPDFGRVASGRQRATATLQKLLDAASSLSREKGVKITFEDQDGGFSDKSGAVRGRLTIGRWDDNNPYFGGGAITYHGAGNTARPRSR
jgi:hypothetical protein